MITRVRKRKFYLSVRDSELCVIPQPLLEFLKSRSMVVMAKLISILGNRLVTGDGDGFCLLSVFVMVMTDMFGNCL